MNNRIYTFCLSIILILVAHSSFPQTKTPIQNKRSDVIKQYIRLLGDGNYKEISHLFNNKAVVVSSSGIPDNPMYFYKTLFTKTISSPHSSLINLFQGKIDHDMMTAYFDFSWNNGVGNKVSAKFLDLFLFEKRTAKINTVFVFSNTFQEDIMKQLNKSSEKE
jgi:hypothetical protein